jgi:hypothetical protein
MPWGHGCPGTATYKEVLMPWGHGCPGTAKDAKIKTGKEFGRYVIDTAVHIHRTVNSLIQKSL